MTEGSPAWKPQATFTEVTWEKKRRIVAERPCAERLARVCVQVDAHAGTPKKGKGIA